MSASPRLLFPVLRPRVLALLLLLAWSPVLLFVDHWPAPALLQPSSVSTPHAHTPTDGAPTDSAPTDSATTGAHVEHGHGGAAESVAGTVLASSPLAAPEIAPPAAAAAGRLFLMHTLRGIQPEPPPPR